MTNTSFTKNASVTYQKGAALFTQGESLKYLYLVKKGEVHLLKIHGQRLFIIKTCKEKEILNEVSILTNATVNFAAIAKTDVELVLIEQQDILSVINSGPAWIPEILKTLCERLKSTQDIIDDHNLLSGEKNSDMILSKDDERKYSVALSEYKAP